MTIYLVVHEDHWAYRHVWAYTSIERAVEHANAVHQENSCVKERPWSARAWFGAGQAYREIDGSEQVWTRKLELEEDSNEPTTE